MANSELFKGYIVINDQLDVWNDEQVSKFKQFAESQGKVFYFCSLSSAAISFENERNSHNRKHSCRQ